MSEPICMFCGEPHRLSDPSFSSLWTERGHAGWHPACWPEEAEDMSDLILRVTPDGIRGHVKEGVVG